MMQHGGTAPTGGGQLAPLPRARERKPAKPKAAEPDSEVEEGRGKRLRKAPGWMAEDHYALEEVPAPVAECIEQAKKTAEPKPQRAPGTTRMVKWCLVGDRNTMSVEMEHGGKHYRGTLTRTGVAPTAGVVLDTFLPGSQVGPGTNNRDQCALCNQSLLKQVYQAEEELQKVVRVAISANWVAHTHLICGLWAPEVYEDKHGNLVNLSGAIRRARALKCNHCKDRGACLSCAYRGCSRVYHLTCARDLGCQLDDENFVMYCPAHASKHGSWAGMAF